MDWKRLVQTLVRTGTDGYGLKDTSTDWYGWYGLEETNMDWYRLVRTGHYVAQLHCGLRNVNCDQSQHGSAREDSCVNNLYQVMLNHIFISFHAVSCPFVSCCIVSCYVVWRCRWPVLSDHRQSSTRGRRPV